MILIRQRLLHIDLSTRNISLTEEDILEEWRKERGGRWAATSSKVRSIQRERRIRTTSWERKRGRKIPRSTFWDSQRADRGSWRCLGSATMGLMDVRDRCLVTYYRTFYSMFHGRPDNIKHSNTAATPWKNTNPRLVK